MKVKAQVIAVVAALLVCSLVVWATQESKQLSSKPVWEYKVAAEVEGHGNFVNLAALGAEGWELVGVRGDEQVDGNFHQKRVFYYFKRQK